MCKHDGFFDKKVESSPGVFVKKEPGNGIAEGGTKVKVDKEWSSNRFGQGDKSGFKCYRCGEAGHIKRNCPKTTVK